MRRPFLRKNLPYDTFTPEEVNSKALLEAPGLLPDWMIRRLVKIEPFSEGVPRDGTISYGLSSYGFDCRVGFKFKIFSPVHCTVMDPKNVDPRSFVDVDIAPRHNWRGVNPAGGRCQYCDLPEEDGPVKECPAH